ncbi:MAG: L,D-transpeptidase family protein [Patescibacteria group bacterium]
MRRVALVSACFLIGLASTRLPIAQAATVHHVAPFGLQDTDGDGIPDIWETQVFHTDPTKADTDGDKFDDWTEITTGNNPNGKGKLKDTDYDHDGLNDRLELLFGTDPTNADTDSDGHSDGQEVTTGFSPTSTSSVPLQKEIVVHLKTQRLDQVLGGVTIASYIVSTGKASTPTPVGTYAILSKNPREWSHMASLWMPWWMQFSKVGDGIHELPEWPNGTKEGADHLGVPVSHGCVRLGVGPAKAMYDWTPIGTPVVVEKL